MPCRAHLSMCAVLVALTAPAAAQRPAPKPAASTTPRTAWGHPDLQGRWTNATVTPLERPKELGAKEYFTADEAAEYQKQALERFLASINFTQEAAISGEFVEGVWVEERAIVPTRRTSLIVGPDGRIPPFTPEGRQRADARDARRKQEGTDSAEARPLGERCLWFQIGGVPMLPGVGYNSNYEIVQTKDHVVIFAEMGSTTRIIPLDGRAPLNTRLQQWRGDSHGRWDGDVLVVETSNFNDQVEFRGSSSSLRVTERFRRASADLILYEATIEDPATWPKAWTVEVPWRPLQGQIYEFACHEANYGLTNILKGARATDAGQRN